MGWRETARKMEADVRRGARLRDAMTAANGASAGTTACWEIVASTSRPAPVHTEEQAAKKAFREYEPSLFELISRFVQGRRKWRFEEVLNARFRDGATTQRLVDEWEWSTDLARRVLSGELAAYADAIDSLCPFDKIEGAGARVEFRIASPALVEVRAFLKNVDTSHRDSDPLCEKTLELARATLACVPASIVAVQVYEDLPPHKSGIIPNEPILAVRIERQKLHGIAEASAHTLLRQFAQSTHATA